MRPRTRSALVPRPHLLKVSFVTPCSAVHGFAAGNGPVRGEAKKADAAELELLRRTAGELDRPMPGDRTVTVWSDANVHDLVNRALAQTELDGQTCQVVGTFGDYS